MTTITHPVQSLTSRPSVLIQAVAHALRSHASAWQVRRDRKMTLARMAALRIRDPRLFAETGFDSNELPPLPADWNSLFPAAVICNYFCNDRQ